MQRTLTFISSLFLFALPACGDDGMGDDGSTSNATPATTTMTTGDDPTGGAAEPNCADYCTAVTTNCTAGNAQYFQGSDSGMTSCMGACAALPKGALTDTGGATLGCRTYHAGAPAMMDAGMHCEHAGPGGAGVCGADCEGFCAIAVATCSAIYADVGACMTECSSFTDDVAYNATVMAGNSLACRLYHLTAASVDAASAATHCPHINAASPVCI